MNTRALLLALFPLVLAACATTGTTTKPPAQTRHTPAPTAPIAHSPKTSPYAPAQEDPSKRGDYVAGGLFRPNVADSVPADIPDVDAIPEPEVRDEPRARAGNRDYTVLGKRYQVLDDHSGYVEEGMASYYGNKFHGRRTSSQEVYDMYAFTAAHKTLPLPSFARVTNLENGKSIIVRINDRGPFHPGRVIDLSYAAAVKLGYRSKGSARVRVEALQPDDDSLARRPPSSAMDGLLAQLPKPAAAGPAAEGNRFDMHQDGRVMSADEFDSWMRSRQIRIATGKPAALSVSLPLANTTPPPAPVASPAPSPMPSPATPPMAEPGSITLQVASFSDPKNAQQALQLLQGAAIARAQLQDADINGKKIWRLRIGPVAEAATPELAARIVGLGFGQPQRVRN